MQKQNIVLIGMRGSGKSHIGRLLAEKLEMRLYDSDKVIEEEIGESIGALVAREGWQRFRDIESATYARLAKKTGIVIATGGGVVVRTENIDKLKKNGVIVFLRVPLADLAKRLTKSSHKRPSLTGADPAAELAQTWKERRKLYEAAADIIIDTPNVGDDKAKDIAEHAERILAKISKL